MKNEENIGHVVRDKRAITILLLTYEISIATNLLQLRKQKRIKFYI